MSNPGANLIAGVRSQQDNRFRKRQQELDEAWRDRQMDLREDQWATTRDWQQDIIDREARQRAFDSELASNYYNELQEQQAYDKAEEDWYKSQYGSYAKLGEGKGLGNVIYDQTQQRLAPWFRDMWSMLGIGGGRMTYEDIHPKGVQMPERSIKALLDLVESGELTPEKIEKMKRIHLKSPSTKGMTTKGLIDLYRVPEWMGY